MYTTRTLGKIDPNVIISFVELHILITFVSYVWSYVSQLFLESVASMVRKSFRKMGSVTSSHETLTSSRNLRGTLRNIPWRPQTTLHVHAKSSNIVITLAHTTCSRIMFSLNEWSKWGLEQLKSPNVGASVYRSIHPYIHEWS